MRCAGRLVHRPEFSVYVGELDQPVRGHAEKLHSQLADPDQSVLVAVSPNQRVLEIVTGEARRRIPDRSAKLAALSMSAAFGGGDLAGGLVSGLAQLPTRPAGLLILFDNCTELGRRPAAWEAPECRYSSRVQTGPARTRRRPWRGRPAPGPRRRGPRRPGGAGARAAGVGQPRVGRPRRLRS